MKTLTPVSSMLAQRRIGVGLFMICLVASAACQVSPPPESAAPGEEPPEPINNYDPCSVLPAEEVAAAVGVEVRSRLLMPVGEASAECWFENPLGRPEVYFVPTSEPPSKPRPPRGDEERVPGVGVAAYWWSGEGYKSLWVWRKSGDAFEIGGYFGGKDAVPMRAAAADLARKVVARLDAPEPGRPGALPASLPAPFEVCQLLSLPDQVRVLGWTTTGSSPGMTWEFVGGTGGGSWECRRSSKDVALVIVVTKTAVSEPELAAAGKPLQGLPRKAFVSEFASIPGEIAEAPVPATTLLTTAGDGRMVKLQLFDPRAPAQRRAAALELTRLVLAKLP